MSNIVILFYEYGGYNSTQFPEVDVIDNYAATAINIVEHLVSTPETPFVVTIDPITFETGTAVLDNIIAYFGLAVADNKFDTLHINPVTGEKENKHWNQAMQLLLHAYGILDKEGELVAPGSLVGRAAGGILVSDSYDLGDI